MQVHERSTHITTSSVRKAVRHQLSLSQIDFAHTVVLSVGTVRDWE
jgi:DNA-binding transcriptional regulator YiaG